MVSKLRRHGFLAIICFVLILFSFGPVALAEDAQDPPQMQYPALYYGTVKTETGRPQAAGTVKAYVEDELCGKISFQEENFGMPAEDPYVGRLIVYSADRDLTGKEVTFKVEVAGREYPAKTDPVKIVWESRTKQAVNLIVAVEIPDGQSSPAGKSFSPFPDLAGHWAEGTVSRMVYQGLLSGYEDGTFRPDNPVTRAECAAILSRALNLPAVGPEGLSVYGDAGAIPGWAQKTVAQAVAAGLFSGYPEPDGSTTFRPDKPVSRVELAAVLSRVLLQKGLAQDSGQAGFTDQDQIPEWAREAVRVVAAAGLAQGYPDGSFQPQKEVTRAEAASMVERLLGSL